jgi:light-regulated signal transduction histidine kinase (bacteriophytochrome)
LKDAEGSVIGLVGIGRDISDRKNADEEIRRLNTELEQRVIDRTAELEAAVHELETFSYSVSHDLRAPLRAINGFSLALVEDKADQLDEEGKSHLAHIIQSTKRMSKIVDDLLKLAKVTQVEMNREDVDLGKIAQSILEELRLAAPTREVEVSIESNMMIQADASLIRILMDNLLNNAWKFTSKRETAHIDVGKTVLEGKSVYYVHDDGAGFDMAYASRLFIAFQRLHNPSEFEGTGIGLATVGRIVKRHGGRVWARSVPGQGSTFYFMLG